MAPAGPIPFDLERFLAAQGNGVHEQALAELRAGRKASHWIWFVFPQVAGLGSSGTSRFYALASLDEARAYLAHPVLGARLRDCADALLAAPANLDAEAILGGIDAVKLRSSMTLFLRADPTELRFAAVLDRFFEGVPDPATDRILAGMAEARS
jgi:uncharacterized protein (DUF1810 family)